MGRSNPAVDALLADQDAQRARIRQALGIPAESLVAISVGRLDESKGYAYAVEALTALVARVPNVHWVVLGEGAQRPFLEARIDELGLNDRVHLVGFVEEPLPWYAAADIYLRTPTFEAENLSSLPALGFGLPVVGFDTGVETELIAKVGYGTLGPEPRRRGISCRGSAHSDLAGPREGDGPSGHGIQSREPGHNAHGRRL